MAKEIFHDYRFEVYRNKEDWEKCREQIHNFPVCRNWYGITNEEAENIVCGIAIGLRAKYAHPFVVLYRIEADKEVIVRTQQ